MRKPGIRVRPPGRTGEDPGVSSMGGWTRIGPTQTAQNGRPPREARAPELRNMRHYMPVPRVVTVPCAQPSKFRPDSEVPVCQRRCNVLIGTAIFGVMIIGAAFSALCFSPPDHASKMARTLATGPRQIGQAAPTNRGASTAHRQRWPHGLIATVGARSKHTTHIGSAPTDVSCTTTCCADNKARARSSGSPAQHARTT